MSRPRVNPYLIASRAALVFGLPLVCPRGGYKIGGDSYPDDPKMRCQGSSGDHYAHNRESDGKSVACISLYGDACGWRIDFHRKGESGVADHPLGSHVLSARELADALYYAESALAFAGKKHKP